MTRTQRNLHKRLTAIDNALREERVRERYLKKRKREQSLENLVKRLIKAYDKQIYKELCKHGYLLGVLD